MGLLRSKYINLIPSGGGSEAKAVMFTGPAWIRHIYFLPQQDRKEPSITSPTPALWNEIKMSLYDSGDTNISGVTPLYEQVVPQAIPDGWLQSVVDDIKDKYNGFVGLKADCGAHGTGNGGTSAASYTGTLANECGAGVGVTPLDDCGGFNKMVCATNWIMDYIGDKIMGTHYVASDDKCAGATSDASHTLLAADYNESVSDACLDAGCTKLNRLICIYNWLAQEIVTEVIGDSSECQDDAGAGNWSSVYDTNCGTNCARLNQLICAIIHMVTKIGIHIDVSSYGIDISFDWDFVSTSGSGLFTFTLTEIGLQPSARYIDIDAPIQDSYLSENWAPRVDYKNIDGVGPQFDFDNYNRNKGFQITFPEPGLYVNKGLVVRQDGSNNSYTGSEAQTHTNIIYQQASTTTNPLTGQVYGA